jgi:inosose dehydratase
VLDETGWATLLTNLDRLAAVAAEHGIEATLHPHVGTMVETAAEVDRVVTGSSIGLTLDTGHLLVGGTDPLDLVRRVPTRIKHAHLKDVRADLAARVRSGELTYTDAVRAGMYVPLGSGDVDIAGIVAALSAADYQGWYVMEQDTILTEAPTGEGPLSDVRASLEFLNGLGR